LVGQQIIAMSTFLVMPVYRRSYCASTRFETGKPLLPPSVAMLMFALLDPRIGARRSPRTVAGRPGRGQHRGDRAARHLDGRAARSGAALLTLVRGEGSAAVAGDDRSQADAAVYGGVVGCLSCSSLG
jgi:hypothetical protein